MLNREQVASLCGVSPARVSMWIEKKELRAAKNQESNQWIRHADMIDFMVKFNMPIPEAILPFQAKKILFIYADDSRNRLFMRFLISLLGQLKRVQSCFIADHAPYGPEAKMKVMVFKPDLILLDMTEDESKAISMSLKIKNTMEFSAIRLVAITAENVFDRFRSAAIRGGIDEVVPDSVDMIDFTKKLTSLS